MSNGPQDSPETGGSHPPGWSPIELPAPPRPPRADKARWIIGLVVLAVVVVGVSLLFAGRGSRGAASPAEQGTSTLKATPTPAAQTNSKPLTISSAADTGPLTIITSDDTCGAWDNVQTAVGAAQKKGWHQRDASVPATAWDPARRSQFEAVADALRSGADTAVTLAAQTPHRVMRELYEAFIGYGRAYADSLPTYQPKDDFLAQTSLAALDSITNICAANRSNVALTHAPDLPPVAPPSSPPAVGDPIKPVRFLPQANPSCAPWGSADAELQSQTEAWLALDPNIGVGQWTPEQRAVHDLAAQVFAAHADKMEAAGRGSGNAVLEDIATLGALYFRAFAQAEPLYWAGDHALAEIGFTTNKLILAACQAVSA